MKTKIYLAPMSGVTDLSFRLICRSLGAQHCFFEMLDSKSIVHHFKKSLSILKTAKNDSPVSAQLLGTDPSEMLYAAGEIMKAAKITSLDINSACPVKKVVKKKAGAALLKDAALLGRIVKELSSNLPIPVTVKLRSGFNKSEAEVCVRAAKEARDNGASCIYIHGRSAAQGYAGDVDYNAIKAVKEAVDIPVFGSGNIFSPEGARKMLDETGCDGILVARGAQGNPWIFKDIEDYLADGRPSKRPDTEERRRVMKEHLAYIKEFKEMSARCRAGFMGKVAMWYLKGLPHAARLRDTITRIRSYDEMLAFIDRSL